MAKSSTSKKKRKPNPAIGDPTELLAAFEREVNRFAAAQVGGLTVGGETANEIVALVRQMQVETAAEPRVWAAYDTLFDREHYTKLVRLTAVVEGFFPDAKRHALPLFRAIHQQLALPPALAKKIDAANRYWSKANLRFPKPAWIKPLKVSGTRFYGPVLAYEGLLKEARKYVALAKEALAAGVSHSAEASKTTLQAGPFRLVNTAHFSDEQMQQIGSVVREAAKRLTDIGLARVCYGDMLMSRQISSRSNVLAFYLTKDDEMFVRGDVKDDDRASLLWTICHELGHRLQFKFMSKKGNALIKRSYMSTKMLERFASSDAHHFPAAGTKIETPIGELTFLGYERLGVVAYLDPKGQKRLTTTQSWQASMGAWDRHYGRGAESLFVSHYASKDADESFAEMVAACATGKTKPAFVATLREILKADGIELLIDTDAPAQRGAELQASVAPHEYAAITEAPEAVARKENPVGPLPEGLRFEKTHLDVKGTDRHQFVVKAYVPGREKRIGYVTYDVVGDVGYIDFVYVDPAYARRGVATAMYSYLAKEEPELLWDRGSTTDDGGHFRAATRDVLPLVPKPTPGFYTMTDGEVMEHYGADEEQLMDEYAAWADAERKRGVEDVPFFETWLRNIRAPHRKANPRAHDALSLAEVRRWEPLAASSGVSDVARGPSGFLTAYKRAGGRIDRLSEDWRAKREAFIARHMAQAKNERMFDDGIPTRRHLALIMWAYSPEAARLREASPRKANPVDDDALSLLKEAGGASSKVKWREAGGAREYMIVAHGQAEVRRIAAALTSSGATVTHDFYADPERGYRALHLRLRSGEPVQVKTARMATLAYAAQGVDAVDDEAFRKICDLAAYADEGDPHAARRFDEIPVTELRSQIARQE